MPMPSESKRRPANKTKKTKDGENKIETNSGAAHAVSLGRPPANRVPSRIDAWRRIVLMVSAVVFSISILSRFLPSRGASAAFKVVDLPGRGKGVIASRRIKQGELLIVEEPLFLVPAQIKTSPHTLLNDVILRISPENRALFFNLSHSPVSRDEELALAIFTNNAISAEDDGVGIFPRTARLNHGCSSAFNAVYRWRRKQKRLVVHALKDIDSGQEILTTYTDTKRPRAERRTYLAEAYKFHCECAVCSLPPTESVRSDARLIHYAELRHKFSTWASGQISGHEAVVVAEEMLKVGAAEGYLSERGRLAADVAHVAAAHSNVELFQKWIRWAIEWSTIELGSEDELVVEMVAQSRDPRRHPAWNGREQRMPL